jgi:N-acyl-D-aspartate/D-glutamate deacylase
VATARARGAATSLDSDRRTDDEQGFAWAKEVRDAGLPVVVQQNSMDPVAEFTLAEYNMFDYMPHWIQPLVGTPEERAAKLGDPAARQAMKQDVEKFPHARTDWHTMIVVQVIQERNRPYEGLTLAELGQKQGKHPLVTVYLDTSTVLRVLLRQPKPLAIWAQWDRAYASELLHVEACR